MARDDYYDGGRGRGGEGYAAGVVGAVVVRLLLFLFPPSFSIPSLSLSVKSLTRGDVSTRRMTTLLDPRLTLSYLAYLGFPHSSLPSLSLSSPSPPHLPSSSNLLPSTSALHLTRPRKPSRRAGSRQPVERNVFLAYVLGAAGSGKTSLLRAFVGKDAGLGGAGGGGGAGEEYIGGEDGLDQASWGRRREGYPAVVVSPGLQGATGGGKGRKKSGGGGGGGEEGRGMGKSVVNSVEEGGGERYLVVRVSLSSFILCVSASRSPLSTVCSAALKVKKLTVTTIPFSLPPDAASRIRLNVRVRSPQEQEEARTGGRVDLCVRLERYKLV